MQLLIAVFVSDLGYVPGVRTPLLDTPELLCYKTRCNRIKHLRPRPFDAEELWLLADSPGRWRRRFCCAARGGAAPVAAMILLRLDRWVHLAHRRYLQGMRRRRSVQRSLLPGKSAARYNSI
jgi:hypothetical protein